MMSGLFAFIDELLVCLDDERLFVDDERFTV
jgi:hypothetical protein